MNNAGERRLPGGSTGTIVVWRLQQSCGNGICMEGRCEDARVEDSAKMLESFKCSESDAVDATGRRCLHRLVAPYAPELGVIEVFFAPNAYIFGVMPKIKCGCAICV